jgi:hypothetical protein
MGTSGEICLLRTGELCRWRRDAVKGMKLWVSNESHFLIVNNFDRYAFILFIFYIIVLHLIF